MASAGVAPSGYKNSSSNNMGVEKLPDQMNGLKIRDDKVQMLCPLFSLGGWGYCNLFRLGQIMTHFLDDKYRKSKQQSSMAKGQKLAT
jgi:hypothetical protein